MDFSFWSSSIKFDDIPFDMDDHDVVYIEKWYHEPTNEFIQTHYDEIVEYFKDKGFRFRYFPLIQESLSKEILNKYFIPKGERILEGVTIGSSFMHNFLSQDNDSPYIAHSPSLLFDLKKKTLMSEDGVESTQYVFNITGLDAETFYFKDSSLSTVLAWIEMVISDNRKIEMGIMNYESDIPDDDYLDAYKDDLHIDEEDVNNIRREIEDKIKELNIIEGHKNYQVSYKSVSPKEFMLSKLVITKDYRIVFPDYDDMEVELNPQQKAVYLFYLNHPEGVKYDDFAHYKKELTYWYEKAYEAKLNSAKKRLETNSDKIKEFENLIDSVVTEKGTDTARFRNIVWNIRDKIREKLKYRPYTEYSIDDTSSVVKKIPLQRDLVEWQCRKHKPTPPPEEIKHNPFR